MKHFMIGCLLLTGTILSSKAQQMTVIDPEHIKALEELKKSYWQKSPNYNPGDSLIEPPVRMVRPGLVGGQFSHNTSRGIVYRMKPDNMPCLVPDMTVTEKMPLKKLPKSGYRMPNAYPLQKKGND